MNETAPTDKTPPKDHRKEFTDRINSLIASGYKLKDLGSCIPQLRFALKGTDVSDEISLMRLFAVVDHIRQCNYAGSVVIDNTQSRDSSFDRLAEELCDSFLEDFVAKMDDSDDSECDFFFEPTNWITIIQSTSIVEERDNFLEMLGYALETRIPIERAPLDHSPDPIAWRLLPSSPED